MKIRNFTNIEAKLIVKSLAGHLDFFCTKLPCKKVIIHQKVLNISRPKQISTRIDSGSLLEYGEASLKVLKVLNILVLLSYKAVNQISISVTFNWSLKYVIFDICSSSIFRLELIATEIEDGLYIQTKM